MKNNVMKALFFSIALLFIGSVGAKETAKKGTATTTGTTKQKPAKVSAVQQPVTQQTPPVQPVQPAPAGGGGGAGVGAPQQQVQQKPKAQVPVPQEVVANIVKQPVPWSQKVSDDVGKIWDSLSQEQQATISAYFNSKMVEWVLGQPVPWSTDVDNRIRSIWNMLSEGQQNAITAHYNAQMQLQGLQQQVQQLQSQLSISPVVKPVEEVEEPLVSAEEKGWFSTLFDYESYLTKYLPKSLTATEAAGAGAATAVAAVYLGPLIVPAIAGYIGVMGALKIAGTAYALDRIGYGLNTGAISESRAIKAIKNTLEQRISDDGTYPTFALKIEALKNGQEFSSLGKVDERIFKLARQEVIDAIRKKAADIFKNDPKEKSRQDAIDTAVMKYRKQSTGKISEYIKFLEKDVNIADLQARISEYSRSKNKVALVVEQKKLEEAQRKLEEMQKKAEEVKKAAAGVEKPAKSFWNIGTMGG